MSELERRLEFCLLVNKMIKEFPTKRACKVLVRVMMGLVGDGG